MAQKMRIRLSNKMMGFDESRKNGYILVLLESAGVAKLVYALDSKSSGPSPAHVGSSPTSGTKFFQTWVPPQHAAHKRR